MAAKGLKSGKSGLTRRLVFGEGLYDMAVILRQEETCSRVVCPEGGLSSGLSTLKYDLQA